MKEEEVVISVLTIQGFDKCNPFHKDASYLLLSADTEAYKKCFDDLASSVEKRQFVVIIFCIYLYL